MDWRIEDLEAEITDLREMIEVLREEVGRLKPKALQEWQFKDYLDQLAEQQKQAYADQHQYIPYQPPPYQPLPVPIPQWPYGGAQPQQWPPTYGPGGYGAGGQGSGAFGMGGQSWATQDLDAFRKMLLGLNSPDPP